LLKLRRQVSLYYGGGRIRAKTYRRFRNHIRMRSRWYKVSSKILPTYKYYGMYDFALSWKVV